VSLSAGVRVRVRRKTVEAEGVAGFLLAPLDAAPLPAFAPGAHIDVTLPGGLTRPYSLCNAPEDDGCYRIAVLHEATGRGGSRAMHAQVAEGDVLQVSAPRNHFVLQETAAFSLLLAGGIGITPLLAMAEHLVARGAAFALHYAGRSLGRMAFVDRLRAPRFAGRVQLHADDEAPLDLHAVLAAPPAGAQLYVCGPAGFMAAVGAQARAAGWPAAALHQEAFGAVVGPTAGDQPFEIELRRSGRCLWVPADRSAAEVLQAAGVALPTACEQGVCGTCLTPVLAGAVEHRDLYLSPEEQAAQDRFLPCCSRAAGGRLVLDL
jgi:vanillate O-demethylase ferredoxin subunit